MRQVDHLVFFRQTSTVAISQMKSIAVEKVHTGSQPMEKQMRAEREKRAQIAESEGERQAKINRVDGEKCEAIAHSEGEKQKRINEAQGKAEEIRLVAEATANGIATIAAAIKCDGGNDAVTLRLAE